MPQIAFMLYYFLNSALPVKDIFKEEVEFILKVGSKGLGISGYEGTHPDMDTDMSAVANIVFSKLGYSAPMPAEQFDKWWVEESLGYEFIGTPAYIPEHTMNVLEAICLVRIYISFNRLILKDKNVGHSDKLKVWKRTVRSLRNVETQFGVAHNSIFCVWRCIISVLFTHSKDYTRDSTKIHYQTLQHMLKFQHTNGGFCHPPFTSPNVEETAFALLTLKAVLRSRDPYLEIYQQKIYQAATKAEQFIRNNWDRHGNWSQESWKARLPQSSGLLSEAVILSSLY